MEQSSDDQDEGEHRKDSPTLVIFAWEGSQA